MDRRRARRRSRATEVAATLRAGPRARADGPLRAPPQRARRATIDGSFLAFARAARRRVEALATELAELGDLARRLARTRAATSRSSSAPRSPPPTSPLAGLTTRRRPRPADAVRRQPRPPRPAHRRRARASTTASSPASTPGSCSSTTRPRRSRSAPCALHAVELLVQRTRGATTASALDWVLWNRGAGAALQGAPAPPRPHDRVLTSWRCVERGQRRNPGPRCPGSDII